MESYEEQAARVKLMADAWNLPEADCDAIRAVLYRLEALEEALKFYADYSNHREGDRVPNSITGKFQGEREPSAVAVDGGVRARKALEATP